MKKFLLYNNSLLAHIGVGILIVGVTCSSVFQKEYNLEIKLKENIKIGIYVFELNNIEVFEKNNYQELMATFNIYKNDQIFAKLKPSKRYYHVSKMITSEAGIYHDWFKDFYVVLGNEKDNVWSAKLYFNPLVNFIWLGVVLMVFSGLMGIRNK